MRCALIERKLHFNVRNQWEIFLHTLFLCFTLVSLIYSIIPTLISINFSCGNYPPIILSRLCLILKASLGMDGITD